MKGLGIFFVVAGHIVPGIISLIIHLFHMPLFFIVSGYLSRIFPDNSSYFRRKSISLLLPYFIYLFIFKLKANWNLISHFFDEPTHQNVMNFVKHNYFLLWGGHKLTGIVTIFWFITCLFLTQQLFNYVSNRFKQKTIILFIAVIFYLLACVNQYFFGWLSYPWGLHIVLCSFLFYTLGNYFGNYIFDFINIKLNIFSIIFSSIVIILLFYDYKLYFDMKYNYYGWFLISPLAAILMTKIIYLLSYKIVKINYISTLLAYSGKSSLTIMFTHQFLHIKLINYCKLYPFSMTLFIFFVCILFHYIISLNSISRLMLLGSMNDFRLLISKFSRRKTALLNKS